MLLELPYYPDKVQILNRDGWVGVLTLWSRTDVILKKLGEPPPCVCAISPFYGDGISQLLANLLYNPQITHLIVVGNNRTDSATELLHYFNEGVEEIRINGSAQCRIRGTTRLINAALVDRDLFADRRPDIHCLCFGRDDATPTIDCQVELLKQTLGGIKPPERLLERKQIKLIESKIDVFPSVKSGHQVIADSPLDAWTEILFLIKRYGLPVELKKGARRELSNLKVVVKRPQWHTDDEYAAYNLDVKQLIKYGYDVMSPDLAQDQTYSYGNRLLDYFGFNALDKVVERLHRDLDDRKCYITTWDQRLDMEDDRGHPCMVGLFFRIQDRQLHLTATFRTHRAYVAWIDNLHGLMTIQRHILDGLLQYSGDLAVDVASLTGGSITVISHSISIDPDQLPLVESVIQARKWKMRDDERGEVVFSVEGSKAIVEHRMGGIVLKRYESANVEALSHQLASDCIVSDLNHSMYVGRQLGKIQMCLKAGIQYEES